MKKIFILTVILFLCFLVKSYADSSSPASKDKVMDTTLAAADSENEAPQNYRRQLKKMITEQEPDQEGSIESEAYYRYVPSRKADAMDGKVSISEASQQTSYELKAFGKLPIDFSVQTSYLGLSNSTPIKFPAKLTGFQTGIEATIPFFNFEKTYFRFGVFPSFYTDNWNFNSSAFRMPNRYMIIKQPNDKWTFVFGVAVFPDFQDEVVPILGFIYKPNDRLTFDIIPLTPTISYKLNEKFTLFCEASTSSGEYEVTKDQYKNVRLEYKEYHLGSGIKYKVNKYINSSVAVGGMFNRQLRYDPDSLGKVNIGNGFYSEFKVEMKI